MTTDNTPRQQQLMKALGQQRETVRTLYAKDVARSDHRLGDVVRELKDRGVEFDGGIIDAGFGLVTDFVMPGDVRVQLYQPYYEKGPSA